jgi:hypothetical protein
MLINLRMNTFSLSRHPTPGMETFFSIFKLRSSLNISRKMIDGVYNTKTRITLSSATLCIVEE